MNIDQIKATIRQRHKLGETADVRLLASTLIVKSIEDGDPYKFTARITTDSLDRQNEVVIPQGGDLREFLASGILSWNHDYSQPVGFPNKSKNVLRGENFIEAGLMFMKRPGDFQGDFQPDFARAFVTQGMAAGINPGVSIGFMPIESRRPSKADYEKYGPDVQLVHSKWKLLELAIAPVQANQDAVVTAVGKGLMKRETAIAVGIPVKSIPKPVIEITIPIPKPDAIVEEMVMIVRSRSDVAGNVKARVEREVKNTLLREWGKVYA